MSPSAFERLIELAQIVDIPIKLVKDYNDNVHSRRFTWDGKTLLLDHYEEAINSCHEVAHYMVAEPWQRSIPDFGLGRGQFSFHGANSTIKDRAEKMFTLKDQSFVDNQEALASMLTYFIAVHVEVPIEDIMADAKLVGWRWNSKPKRTWNTSVQPNVLTVDESPTQNYDEREMGTFFHTALELHELGLLKDQQLTLKLNTHVRSPLDSPA